MAEIKSWAFSVCCAAIICGLLNMIFPEGSGKKIFKSVLCVFFLCIVISPFSEFEYSDILSFIGKDYDIAFNSEKNEFNKISEEYLKNEIIKSTEELLNKEETGFKDILLEVNISEDQSIDINDFTVIVFENINKDELIQKIFEKTGIKPEIIVSGEN